MNASATDFREVTEVTGHPISGEQLERLVSRYRWAADFCHGKDVVEVACGAGPGIGLLASVARSFAAGDGTAALVEVARAHYGDRVPISCFDAQALPFADSSRDVIILCEALYYLPRPEEFFRESARVLRDGGRLLIVTANKDLWDFHPSPYSQRYFGVGELRAALAGHGFETGFFGFQAIDRAPLRQRLLRPVKRAAVAFNMIPGTMAGKRWLKRFVFGAEQPMPAEITSTTGKYIPPERIADDAADRRHKILYCAATLTKGKP